MGCYKLLNLLHVVTVHQTQPSTAQFVLYRGCFSTPNIIRPDTARSKVSDRPSELFITGTAPSPYHRAPSPPSGHLLYHMPPSPYHRPHPFTTGHFATYCRFSFLRSHFPTKKMSQNLILT